mmetsp:Transcript_1880/g.4226  ORF Transcript_1880/g.4226 Transcript_1880/m.4226 type:complete len:215 (+) Transcript_1880:878-1522(+)
MSVTSAGFLSLSIRAGRGEPTPNRPMLVCSKPGPRRNRLGAASSVLDLFPSNVSSPAKCTDLPAPLVVPSLGGHSPLWNRSRTFSSLAATASCSATGRLANSRVAQGNRRRSSTARASPRASMAAARTAPPSWLSSTRLEINSGQASEKAELSTTFFFPSARATTRHTGSRPGARGCRVCHTSSQTPSPPPNSTSASTAFSAARRRGPPSRGSR